MNDVDPSLLILFFVTTLAGISLFVFVNDLAMDNIPDPSTLSSDLKYELE